MSNEANAKPDQQPPTDLLEEQLDALIRQIAQTEPEAVPPEVCAHLNISRQPDQAVAVENAVDADMAQTAQTMAANETQMPQTQVDPADATALIDHQVNQAIDQASARQQQQQAAADVNESGEADPADDAAIASQHPVGEADTEAEAAIDTGDALAEQIQSLLDQSQAELAHRKDRAPEDAIEPNDAGQQLASDQTSQMDQAEAPIDPLLAHADFEAPDEKIIAEAAAANAQITREASDATPITQIDAAQPELENNAANKANQTGDEGIDQLDAMLADQADQAVAGDFETVNDVMQVADDASATDTAATASTDATADTVTAGDDDDDELAGAFQSPEEVLSTTDETQPHSSADAAAVAAELDNQPENQPALAGVDHAPSPKAAARPGGLSLALARLRKTCAIINFPVNMLPVSMRDTVGWVAISVVVPAICLCLYGLLFQ